MEDLRDSLRDKELVKMIDSAELVSFDVFDTLLLRIVNTPETVFSCLGDYFGMKDFEAYRVKMQIEASTKAENELGWPHPTFDQIYDHIKTLDSTPYDELNIDWDKVREAELQMERDVLKVNPEIKAYYDYAISQGKKVVAVSDMYLEEDFLREVLEANGYKFSAIYDSANVHKTKWVGDLYEHVLSTEGISGPHMLHIGDNESSDYENAAKYGIVSYHYKSEITMENKTPRNVCVGYGAANCVYKEGVGFWSRFGARVGGPLYLGLMQWFLKQIEKESYEKIYFLARDGYNLYHLFKEFTDLPVEYLYTSRRALLLANITRLDEETLRSLPPFSFGQTVRDALDIIEMTDLYSDCIDKVGYSSLDDTITDDDIAHGWFKDIYQYHEEEFLARCAKERENAKKHFEEIGFYDVDSIIFDCGWNGSSQYLLDRFLEATGYDKKNRFLYTGILDNEKSRFQIQDRDFEAYLFSYDDNHIVQNRIRNNIVLLELFFSSPERSVYNYSDTGIVFSETDEECSFKKELLEGIRLFMKYTYDFVNKYGIEVTRENAISELLRFVEQPTNEEAIMIGDLPYDDAFAKRGETNLKIASFTREQYDAGVNLDMLWTQGFFKRDDIDIKLKKLLCYNNGWEIRDYMPQEVIEEKLELIEEEKIYDEDVQRVEYENKLYTQWYKKYYTVTKPYVKQEYEPLISVVIPVYNVVEYQLRECIDSIIEQTYPNWELYLVDDNSSWESVRDVLRTYEDNPQINVIYRQENGHISKATNDGIFAAKGEFIAFIDCDDYIESRAFAEMVYYLNKHPETDFVYSDEDKVSEYGRDVHSPFFKPDWSPDTILSVMYTNHLAIYRRELVCEVGGLRTEYNGAQDYDFTLRFMEKSDNKRVGHVPIVLYHWRARPESVASSMDAKPYAIDAMRRLKEDYIKRNDIDAELEYLEGVCQYRINYGTRNNPLVSIIIPSKDNPDMLKQCITSIDKYTDYRNYEIIVVDNGSAPGNKNIIASLLAEYNATYIYKRMEFNFSRMCNMGVEAAKGEYILLLNDDVEAIKSEWLSRMLGQAMQPHIGAVGAKLLYPNSIKIQHIGITNLPVGPCHMFMRFKDDVVHYFGRNLVTYNWLAVTGACLMVSKNKYNEVGGLDEDLTVAYNDVDLCFKLYEAGYYNAARMDAKLYHHESYSRGYDDVTDEKKARLKRERDILYNKHRELFGIDPFHSLNYGVDKIDYDINMYDVGVHNYDVVLTDNIYPSIPTKMCAQFDGIYKEDMAKIKGWAFTDDYMKDLSSKRYILLRNKANQVYRFPVERSCREDLSLQFSIPNLTEGFTCNIDRKLLATNMYDYEMGVLQENADGSVDYVWTNSLLPHDGIEEIPYIYYSRTVSIGEMSNREDIQYSFDGGFADELVSTRYGAFNNLTRLRGWAYLNGTKSVDCRVEIGVKISDDEMTLYDTNREPRYDVARAMPNNNVYMCGFGAEIPYKLEDMVNMYIVITDMKTNKSFYKEVTNIESICGVLD